MSNQKNKKYMFTKREVEQMRHLVNLAITSRIGHHDINLNVIKDIWIKIFHNSEDYLLTD